MKKVKALKQSIDEYRTKSDKGSKTHPSATERIEISKSSKKSVENSTCLHSDSFKTKID